MNYLFDVEEAEKYGVNEAILLYHFKYWLRKNLVNDKNIYDGKAWTYNTNNAFIELFPFWSIGQIRRILKSMEKQDLIETGNYNKSQYDRTKWYSLKDQSMLELPSKNQDSICGNEQIHLLKSTNGFGEIARPIPDNKPDNKPDNIKDLSIDKSPNKVPYDEIVKIYHEKLPMLPSVVKLTEKRKRQIKVLWNAKNDGLPELRQWENFFIHVSKSRFLTGKTDNGGRHPFIANLEWITNYNNFIKISEDHYHG